MQACQATSRTETVGDHHSNANQCTYVTSTCAWCFEKVVDTTQHEEQDNDFQ
eukprot:m.270499 g.270499  ORF g.270499 m.270499 type:complete len:52 (-) comp15681_c1_seq1:2608-2763(-)